MKKNDAGEDWTPDSEEETPLLSTASPPYHGKRGSGLGSFHVRDGSPTIDEGWDVKGDWDVSPDGGVVILSMQLVPSQYVTDGADPGRARPRDESEFSRHGIKSTDLRRMKVGKIRTAIRRWAGEALESPFYKRTAEVDANSLASAQVALLESAATGTGPVGRPRTTDSVLDEWARDVIEVLADPSTTLYDGLYYRWDVSDSTIKNHRLPILRKTDRLIGTGRAMAPGPNYPRKESENGEDT